MRGSWKTVSAIAFGAVVGLAAVGCQTYDFEPVEPISIARQETEKVIVARNLKPNVLLLVDKSGSMDEPVNSSASACQSAPGCGKPGAADCPSSCATRWDDLQSAMDSFLKSEDTSFFRLGLTTFPQPPATPANQVTNQLACTATTSVLMNIANLEGDAELKTHAGQVLTQLKGITRVDTGSYGPDRTGGGTPTALSIKYVRENVPELQSTSSGRASFVILLTDGLPNCNPNNPNLGDTDRNGSVAEINALRQAGVKTIVVGFGADTAGQGGPETLRDMALAGGYERTCNLATDCGTGQTCNGGVCSEPYFQAASGTQLASALGEIAKAIQVKDACTFVLDTQPSDPALLSVRINGERVPATSADGATVNWAYQSPSVVFQNAVCDQIKASTSANPIRVSIVSVQGG